jgi:type I restriction enzyme S subunit
MSDFVTLGNHITIQKGKAPLATGYSGPGAKPYLNPEYLRGRASAELAKPGSDAVHAGDGDTILLWDGSNAGEFFKAKSGLAASTMAKITPDARFNSAYFFHVTKHAETHLKGQTNGTGIPHVDREVLEDIRVFCPEPVEQLRLAEILDTLDTAIRETEAIIAKLKAIKQGLLHDLLTRGIDANGELRPPQAEAPHLYKSSPLGWIPKEWDTAKLSKSFGLISGQHIEAELCNSVGKGVPYFTGPSDFLGAGTVVTQYTTRPQIMCDKADILMTVKGSGCGKVAISDVQACISRQLMAIKVSARSLHYWFAVFQSLQKAFNRMATGGNIPGISRAQILELLVATPKAIEEMEAIGNRIQSTNARLDSEQLTLEKLRLEKSGLMDDLLTGRVRVTPLLAEATQQLGSD